MDNNRTQEPNRIEHTVALFPIPEMVSFPGTVVPLHVFEPRYRAMINHCLESQMPLAVSHIQNVISKNNRSNNTFRTDGESPNNNLNKNQTTYEPCSVFSAGLCKLISTTDDGRMHIEVKLTHRLSLNKITQHVPFKIAQCSELLDDEIDLKVEQEQDDKMQEIYAVLLAISESQSSELHQLISQKSWQQATPSEFSFKVFQYFRFDADFMQQVLATTSVNDRLDLIWNGINQSLQR